MKDFAITVYGRPEPQGSSRAFVNKFTGKAAITCTNKKMMPFRQEVTRTAMAEAGEFAPLAGEHVPVEVTVDFYFDRPKSAKKRVRPSVKPDVDKLLRCVLDGLTGVAFKDDAQVVDAHPRKFYGSPERTEIVVREAV